MSHQNERDAIRAYMRARGVNYTAARRAISDAVRDFTHVHDVDHATAVQAISQDLLSPASAKPTAEPARPPVYKVTHEDQERQQAYWLRFLASHGLNDHGAFAGVHDKLPTEVSYEGLHSIIRGERWGYDARFRLAKGAWFNDHRRIYSSFFGLVIMYSPYSHGPGRAEMGQTLPEESLSSIRETASLNRAVWASGRVGEGSYAAADRTLRPHGKTVHTVSIVFVIPLAGYEAEAKRFARQVASQFQPLEDEVHPVQRRLAPTYHGDDEEKVVVESDRRGAYWARWLAKHGLVRASDYGGTLPTETETGRLERFLLPDRTWFADHCTVYSSFFGLVVMYHPYPVGGDERMGERPEGWELKAIRDTAAMNDAVWAVGRIGEGPYSWTYCTTYPDGVVLATASVVFIIPLVGYREEAQKFARRLARQFQPKKAELHPALRSQF